jgi:hypothetical protein
MRTTTYPIERDDRFTDRTVDAEIHPAVFLGLAVGVGVLVGAMTARRWSRRPDAARSNGTPVLPLRERSAKVAQLATAWEHISDALLGVATAKAVDAIAGYVPGFKEQYERRSSR